MGEIQIPITKKDEKLIDILIQKFQRGTVKEDAERLMEAYVRIEGAIWKRLEKLPKWSKECECEEPIIIRTVNTEDPEHSTGLCLECGGWTE